MAAVVGSQSLKSANTRNGLLLNSLAQRSGNPNREEQGPIRAPLVIGPPLPAFILKETLGTVSMATSGRGSGVVGYNTQVAVDTRHHLIVAHEVTNVGSDRAQLANMADLAKAVLERSTLDVIADWGYFSSEEILKCEQAGITVTLPKPMTSNAKAEGRFGKQDFRYTAAEDVYICPAGEQLTYRYTNKKNGLLLRRY